MTKWPLQTLGVLGVLSQLKMSNRDCLGPEESVDNHIVGIWNKNDIVTSANPISCQLLNIFDVRPEPFQFPSNFGSKWYSKYNPDGHLGSQPKLVLSCSKVPCFQLVFQIKSRWSFDSHPKLVLQANEIHLKIFDFQISWAFFNTRSVNSNTQLALEKFL